LALLCHDACRKLNNLRSLFYCYAVIIIGMVAIPQPGIKEEMVMVAVPPAVNTPAEVTAVPVT
jgi:hypothetical protein